MGVQQRFYSWFLICVVLFVKIWYYTRRDVKFFGGFYEKSKRQEKRFDSFG